MKVLLGFLVGVIVATAGYGWAECCGGFNVPLDTQLAIEQELAWSETLRGYERQKAAAYASSRRLLLGVDTPFGPTFNPTSEQMAVTGAFVRGLEAQIAENARHPEVQRQMREMEREEARLRESRRR